MSEYPILVERFDGQQSLTIACQKCHATAVITADDIRNEMDYDCPKGCGGWAVYKYDEGDKCPNCKKLGRWSEALDHCCSRVCQLQTEYAKELLHAATEEGG